MAIIYQHDKRSGITYAYDSFSYRDKETKKVRAIRKLIGRVDKETGEIVATDGRRRKDKVKEEAGEQIDYKELCEKLQNKLAAQEVLIQSLQKQLNS